MKKYWLQRGCSGAFWVLSAVLAAVLFGLNFWYTAVISYDTYEHITITETPLRGLWFVTGCAVMVLAVYCFGKYAQIISERAFFCVFAVAYIIMGAYIINGCDGSLRSDPLMVYDAARQFSLGNLDYFNRGSYLHSYPHQTGLMLYDALLRVFGGDPSVNFFVNLFLVIGINYTIYRIADLMFENRLVNVISIVFAFAFLPQLFFVMFAYGLIPGMFFMCLAIYFALKLTRTGRLIYVLPLSVFSGLAVFVRKNYIIGVLAIGIYLVFMSKDRLRIRLLAALCVIACAIVPMKLVLGYFENRTGNGLDNGVPSVMWIAMGTDLDNRDRAPGWYNGFNYYTYIANDHDAEITKEIGEEKLKQNLERMKEEPLEAYLFFCEKAVSMWCENTYQSMWSGPLEECSQYTETELLKDIYNGGETEKDIAYFCEGINQAVWLFALLFIVIFGREKDGWQIMMLFFTGGFLFHLMWEGKSQYIYPYVFCLIPCSAYAAVKCSEAAGSVLRSVKAKFLKKTRV